MLSLLICLRSEFYKSRKTLAFWASILLPLLICGLVAFAFISNQHRILKLHYPPEALWLTFSSFALGPMGTLILPFYVIFMAFSVNNIEHKNDTWKSLFAQPLNRLSVYSAKYLYAVVLIFISLFLFAFLTYAFGNLVNLVVPDYKFNGYNPMGLLSKIYLKLFLSSLGMLSLQFILSLIWSDFLKPMGIGFVGIIIGIITVSKGWEYSYFIPYSHPMLAMTSSKSPEAFDIFSQGVLYSLVYAAVFFTLGYFIVAKKSIK